MDTSQLTPVKAGNQTFYLRTSQNGQPLSESDWRVFDAQGQMQAGTFQDANGQFYLYGSNFQRIDPSFGVGAGMVQDYKNALAQQSGDMSPKPVSLPDGTTVYTNPTGVKPSEGLVTIDGKQYNAQGNYLIPNLTQTGQTNAPSGTPANPAPASPSGTSGAPATPGSSSQQTTQAQQLTDQQFQDWLGQQNLSADQKAAVSAIYGAIGNNDQATADKVLSAMKAAAQYSDPYFKAQISIATDALTRGLSSNEHDLAFKETSLNNTLQDLTRNIGASKDYLTFQQQQELTDLKQKYETDLSGTQDALASRGMTSSSVRNRQEEILGDNYNGMVESTNKQLAYQTGNMDAQLASAQRDNTQQLAYYEKLAGDQRLNALRGTEEQIGSKGLTDLGYSGTDVLGGVGGSIPAAQTQDELNFANSYVF